ncbi:MAG TPA: hypothetical protein VFV23_12425 [Verrucomicrobiae bacterium]|nr:hypothetical protein [Verrucomicrobiae bacterium]
MVIANLEISVNKNFCRVAKLRHEWFDYVAEPAELIRQMREANVADVFTFVEESHVRRPELPFRREPASISVLTIKSFNDWWNDLHFKARNKARKAQKCGVEIREAGLTDDFVRGVEKIYNECPLRQGRKFTHYGETFDTIKNDLSSFLDRSIFVGAYFNDELIGFMKLFVGNEILRMIHILATFADRDKCVMDALIARAVKLCAERKIHLLHYGDWASRGLGVFREKYNFQRHDCPRYFVPLNWRGQLLLNFGFHRPLRERLPRPLVNQLAQIRNQWNALRYGATMNKETKEAFGT